MSDEESLYGDAVYADGVEDASDPDAAEQLLDDDRDALLDTGYSPPDREPSAARYGMTATEQLAGEPLERRLSQEVPDVDADASAAREDDRSGGGVSAEEAAMHTVDDSSLG